MNARLCCAQLEPVRESFSWKDPAQLLLTLLGPVYYNQFMAGATFALVVTVCLLIGPQIVSTLLTDEGEALIHLSTPVKVENPEDIAIP